MSETAFNRTTLSLDWLALPREGLNSLSGMPNARSS